MMWESDLNESGGGGGLAGRGSFHTDHTAGARGWAGVGK